jgi:hypothetical protein
MGSRQTFRSPRTFVVAACLLVALLATACGSSAKKSSGPNASTTSTSAPSGSSSTPTNAPAKSSSSGGANPCTLVTSADVQAIIGSVPAPTGPRSENRGVDCKWDAGNGSFVTVQVFHGKEFFAPASQANSPKNLAGVGDQAFEDASGTTSVNVGFLKGSTAVFIFGFNVKSADAVVAAAKDAASKV